MAYMALMIGLVKQYDKNVGIRTLMLLLMPYTLWYGAAYVILFIALYLPKLPLGPGTPMFTKRRL